MSFYANMRLPHIAAFVAYFSSVHVAYFSAKIGIFGGNFDTTCVFITYFY